MGKSGGGGGGDTVTTIRYAPYVEAYHQSFLSAMDAARVTAVANNPFSVYTQNRGDVNLSFFGAGYVISSFPALYDMYGKFMAGLDVEVLWTQLYTDTVDNSEIGNLVVAEAALLDDDIETNILPRFETGMRDINAVMSSSFIVGRSIIENARTKSLAKFDAELRYRMIPIAQERWTAHLNWNKQVVATYAELMKFYFLTRHDMEEMDYSFSAKYALWPFTVMEYERAALGALQGAHTTTTDAAGTSTVSKVLGGALGGAAAGALIGAEVGAGFGLPGMAIGGVLGGLAGLFG